MIAIEAMEMPDNCDKCCLRHMGLARCNVTGKSTSHHPTGKPLDETKRPKWCPLIEVPNVTVNQYGKNCTSIVNDGKLTINM